MTLTTIVCSNCGYTMEMPVSTMPHNRANATCPKCKKVLIFDPASTITQQETPSNIGPRQFLLNSILKFAQMSENSRLKIVLITAGLIIATALVLAYLAPPPNTKPNADDANHLSVQNHATPPLASDPFPPELFKANKKINPEAVKYYFLAIVSPLVFAALLYLIVNYKRVPSPIFIYDFIEKITSPFIKVSSKRIQELVDDSNIAQAALPRISTSTSKDVLKVDAGNDQRYLNLRKKMASRDWPRRVPVYKTIGKILAIIIPCGLAITIFAGFNSSLNEPRWSFSVSQIIGIITLSIIGCLITIRSDDKASRANKLYLLLYFNLVCFITILNGIKMIQKKVIVNYRGISYTESQSVSYGEQCIALGIIGIISTPFLWFYNKSARPPQYVICQHCLVPLSARSVPNLTCPVCGQSLEDLRGFYERHPELKDSEKDSQ